MANDKALRLAFILSATDNMTATLEKAAANANGSFSKFEQISSKIGKSIIGAGMTMSVFGRKISSTAVDTAKSVASYASSVSKFSQKVGMNTEEWQKLAYAGSRAGMEQDELAGIMVKFDKFISSALSGSSKDAIQIFKDLGISLKDASGKSRDSQEIFKDFANIFESVEDSVAKTTLATEIFGKSGANLIPMLNKGKKGLIDLGEEAAETGQVLDNLSIQAGKSLNRNLKFMEERVQGLKMQIGAQLIPVMNSLVDRINLILKKIFDWANQHKGIVEWLGKTAIIGGTLLTVVGSLAILIGGTSYVILQFGKAIRGISAGIKIVSGLLVAAKNNMLLFKIQYYAFAIAQKLAAAAQWLFNASLFGCPVVWIIAGVAAIGAAAYLLVKNWDKVSAFLKKLWNGIKSVFSSVWDWIKNMFLNYTPYGLIIKHWDKITTWFSNLWKKIKDTFSAWSWIIEIPVYYFSKLWNKVKSVFSSAWGGIKNMLLKYTPVGLVFKHWDSINDWFSGLWGKVKSVFSSAWGGIENMFLNYTPYGLIIKHWDSIKDWFSDLWGKVKTIFSVKWQAIGDFFSGLKVKFFEWGKNLLQGLIDGITSMINKPLDAIKNLGENLGKKFKTKLGINSPSRLFLEYGINITKGLTGGIDMGLPAIANTTGRMAMQAVNGFGQSFQVNTERIEKESIYERLQRNIEPSGQESNIIPASQIFNNSNYNNSESSPVNYNQYITFSGNMTERDKQDFSQMLRQHAKDITDIIRRDSNNRERLSFHNS